MTTARRRCESLLGVNLRIAHWQLGGKTMKNTNTLKHNIHTTSGKPPFTCFAQKQFQKNIGGCPGLPNQKEISVSFEVSPCTLVKILLADLFQRRAMREDLIFLKGRFFGCQKYRMQSHPKLQQGSTFRRWSPLKSPINYNGHDHYKSLYCVKDGMQATEIQNLGFRPPSTSHHHCIGGAHILRLQR